MRLFQPADLSDDARNVQRQAFAGMLWSKQFYHYDVDTMAATAIPASRRLPERQAGRNHDWTHLYNEDIISMPDKWEYPWYAAWDLAFQCMPLALVDPEFAKSQLVADAARMVHASQRADSRRTSGLSATSIRPCMPGPRWRVYKIERKLQRRGDRRFSKRVFHKLLMNFTWWVNRKDARATTSFEGGFLGLDNIGIFDRQQAAARRRLPRTVGRHQLDGDVLPQHAGDRAGAGAVRIRAYEDIASKFFEHFLSHRARHEQRLATSACGMKRTDSYYDVTSHHAGRYKPSACDVRSMVGLIPLFAVETLEPDVIDRLPGSAAHGVVPRRTARICAATWPR